MEEENCYLAASAPPLHDVSLVLFDTAMRPEECHLLRWEFVNWSAGRHGIVLIKKGKTKAARRLLPLSPRVSVMLQARCGLPKRRMGTLTTTVSKSNTATRSN
jgi:integrase